MNKKEWEDYKRRCDEFQKELDGAMYGVLGASVLIMVVVFVSLIISKFG